MKVAAYIGLAMGLLFTILGLIMPFYPPAQIEKAFTQWGLGDGAMYILAVILVAYGLFRFSRSYKILKGS